MALDPEILILDEPSAGLDPIVSAGLDELILFLKRSFGMTILVVTHELKSAFHIADRVAMLYRGRVIAVDTKEGFAGNAHRHAPDGWMPSIKYLVEELGMDVNQRDQNGFTPLHHAAARGDNEMIQYLVSKGGDVKAVARNGMTTVDMANGPVQRVSPIPATIALLEKLGAKNTHRCVSC